MSADNGIYILKTLRSGIMGPDEGYEYRVAHCQAIENIFSEDQQDKFLIMYFGKCEVIEGRLEALVVAQDLYDEYNMVEYGIQTITLEKEFPEIKT